MSAEEFQERGAAYEEGTPWPSFEKLIREGDTLLERAEDELGCSDAELQNLLFSEDRFNQLTPHRAKIIELEAIAAEYEPDDGEEQLAACAMLTEELDARANP